MNNPSVRQNQISTIEAALAHCATHCNHPVLSSGPSGFTPTRLLFVGSGTDPHIRLIATEEEEEEERTYDSVYKYKYSALSYCWGNALEASKQCTTTTSSLAFRKKGIKWAELSPIVQDTITVTKRLGISYLWIDALCILQDDISDWEAESAVMGQIYSNAYVTIVGLNSTSCAVGFLNGRWGSCSSTPGGTHGTSDEKGAVSDQHEEATVEEDSGREEVPEKVDPSTWKFASAMSKARWSTRGWTFQEKALSTRLLYFDAVNVHIRCANFTFREGKRGPLLGRQLAFLEPTQGGADLVETISSGTQKLGDRSSMTEELLELWRNIFIPRFATCEFSRPSDNLPAISGLARFIGDVSGYNYASGLWAEELWREVAWYGRLGGRKTLDQSRSGGFGGLIDWLADNERYIAPTWSWAREGGGMQRLDFLDIPMRTTDESERRGGVDIVAEFKVNVELKGLNPYGQVTGGELSITSKILPLFPREYLKDNSGFELDWAVDEGCELPDGLEMVLIGRYAAMERGPPDSVNIDQRHAYGLVVCLSPMV